jgi:hypothetical protein
VWLETNGNAASRSHPETPPHGSHGEPGDGGSHGKPGDGGSHGKPGSGDFHGKPGGDGGTFPAGVTGPVLVPVSWILSAFGALGI